MSDSGENSTEKDISFTLEVSNKMGIHARPAAMIVRISSRFEGDIWVEKDGEKVNAKSIMGIMMLAASKGTVLTFHVNSNKCDDFQKEMSELFSSKFQDE
ncbi:MAG: HPr family phosphocarrier protein [Opitutae bacterium]|jgi:phosphocarrier protein HPr|nr:HPr family phosphocarrier protein [Opitutae bacterium]